MSTIDDVISAIGQEMPDDVAVLKAKVASMEQEIASMRNAAARNRFEYFRWLERRGRGFALSEELVCALGLADVEPTEAAATALARITALQDVAAQVLAANPDAAVPAVAPQSWSSIDGDDTYDTTDDLLQECVDAGDGGVEVREIYPVWAGRSRYAVISPYAKDDADQIRLFLSEVEAEAFAAERREEFENMPEEG